MAVLKHALGRSELNVVSLGLVAITPDEVRGDRSSLGQGNHILSCISLWKGALHTGLRFDLECRRVGTWPWTRRVKPRCDCPRYSRALYQPGRSIAAMPSAEITTVTMTPVAEAALQSRENKEDC